MSSMENVTSKAKPEREARAVSREVELRALGREAAEVSLHALKLARRAAELAKSGNENEAA